MKFLTNLFTGSDNMVLNAAFSLALVLMLILLIAWIIKFFSRSKTPTGTTSRRRLSIVESIAIDARRKLVLVRHGDREHLIMIGGSQDLVVEANTRPSGQARPDARSQPPRQKSRPKNTQEVWREPQRRRQFAAAKGAARPDQERPDAPPRKNNPDGARERQPAPARPTAPPIIDDAEWTDQQSQIAQLREELAENKSSLQQLQTKRLHPGLRADANRASANADPASATPAQKARQKSTKKDTAATPRQTPPLKGKSVAKLNVAIQQSVTAKKAPHNDDSDTVSAKRPPQSAKRAKSGAKKTVSRRKPAPSRPSK